MFLATTLFGAYRPAPIWSHASPVANDVRRASFAPGDAPDQVGAGRYYY